MFLSQSWVYWSRLGKASWLSEQALRCIPRFRGCPTAVPRSSGRSLLARQVCCPAGTGVQCRERAGGLCAPHWGTVRPRDSVNPCLGCPAARPHLQWGLLTPQLGSLGWGCLVPTCFPHGCLPAAALRGHCWHWLSKTGAKSGLQMIHLHFLQTQHSEG